METKPFLQIGGSRVALFGLTATFVYRDASGHLARVQAQGDELARLLKNSLGIGTPRRSRKGAR